MISMHIYYYTTEYAYVYASPTNSTTISILDDRTISYLYDINKTEKKNYTCRHFSNFAIHHSSQIYFLLAQAGGTYDIKQ